MLHRAIIHQLFDDGCFREREEKCGSFEFGADNKPLPSPNFFWYEEEQSTRQGDLGSVMCREESKAGKIVNG